ENQRQLLRGWRIPVRQIGHEVGRSGAKDAAIIPLLHRLSPVTFFTRDLGFYEQRLCHAGYCIVVLAVGQYEAASIIRRVLRHPELRTSARRLGKVIRASHSGLRLWELHASEEVTLGWRT
ncbi:hypothetical protein JXD38_04275, partial [candidate division WOR-3 bacterium]|nr:hypothetical protein [candidate division WOR-3 bacterium]